MHRERVSENVYWFQSEIYAQVTAGVVVGPQWAVVIDTLALPEETLAMREFIEEQVEVPVRYVINTHYHADHTWGTCFFPGATVISHGLCRKALIEKGEPSLVAAISQNAAFKQVKIIYPHLTFSSGQISLRVGKKNLVMMPTPGHSEDSISILVEEDRILFAGDAFLPLPYIVDGNLDVMCETITQIGALGLENIIQGHGDIILRGEVEESTQDNLNYLINTQKAVEKALDQKDPMEFLHSVSVESCGKSRIFLGGLAEQLHQRNLRTLYQHLTRETRVRTSSENTQSIPNL